MVASRALAYAVAEALNASMTEAIVLTAIVDVSRQQCFLLLSQYSGKRKQVNVLLGAMRIC